MTRWIAIPIAVLTAILVWTAAPAPPAKASGTASHRDESVAADFAVPGHKIGLTCVACNYHNCNCNDVE